MPDRAKVRWSQLKIGVLGLVGFLILFALVFLLTSAKGILRKNILLRTYMDDASGIAAGTPVRLNGIGVGYLDKVVLSGSHDPRRTVEFDMLVQEKFQKDIPVDSVVGIAASNLLGDKFLNITQGRSPQRVKDGAELPALETRDIPELMAQSANLLQSLQTIVGRLDSLLAGVEAGNGNIGKLLKDTELYDHLNAITAESQKLLADVRNGKGTLSKLIYDGSLYDEMRAPLKRVDAILADMQAGQGTAGKLLKDPALYDEGRQTIAEMRTLLAGVNAGRGTAGKLVTDQQLYNRLQELTAKLNTIMDKINAGQGTIGQFVTNPALYESLSGATKEFQSLAKDIRANPKKFLSIRLTLF